jgi:hypothetical protein
MKRYFKKIKNIIVKNIPKRKVIQKANLFIIGAQKSGTSTLFDNLVKHKNIFGGLIKEKNFFSHEALLKNGVAWYHNLFPKPSIFYRLPKTHYFLDASPSYLAHKEVADRIYKYNPDAKFVVMMRNPVDRAFSAWNMYRQMNLLNDNEKIKLFNTHIKGSSKDRESKFRSLIHLEKFPTFEEMVQDELHDFSTDSSKFPGILSRGIYFLQIEYYFKIFDSNQFFFIFAEEFKVNKTQILNDLMSFLNLEEGLQSEELNDSHIREYKQKLTQETRDELVLFFAPHNEKLFALINKKINWSK